jgi:co-chaperonin GroES (HSP10)
MQYPSVPDSLLVRVQTHYKDEVETATGVKLFIDTSFRPEWHVTVTGKVLSAPGKLSLKAPYEGMEPIVKAGDEVAFSYLALFDRSFSDDLEQVFFEEAPMDVFITTYSNKQGLRLMVRYRLDDKFDCAAFDPEGHIYEKAEKLSETQKENWLSNFPLRENSTMKLQNLIEYKGEELFMVHYGHLIGIKRGEDIQMVGGQVLVEEFSKSEVDPKGAIILLNQDERELKGGGIVRAVGAALPGKVDSGVKPGDRVHYEQKYAQQYELWGKEYKVLSHRHLLAKE